MPISSQCFKCDNISQLLLFSAILSFACKSAENMSCGRFLFHVSNLISSFILWFSEKKISFNCSTYIQILLICLTGKMYFISITLWFFSISFLTLYLSFLNLPLSLYFYSYFFCIYFLFAYFLCCFDNNKYGRTAKLCNLYCFFSYLRSYSRSIYFLSKLR